MPRLQLLLLIILINSQSLSVASGMLLQTFNDPTPSYLDEFGRSVALDGNNVLTGKTIDIPIPFLFGQAHLFDASTGNLLQTFRDPTPTSRDEFGSSVAVDSNNVLIGAPLDDTNGTNVGQAHLFDASTGNLLQTFNDPTPTGSDEFGRSVTLNGNNVLIGARFDDTNGTSVGQAHLFDASTGNLLQTFNDPTPTSGDYFGSSVALNGNNVLIGAFGDDTNGTQVGQAHLFDALTGNLLQTFNDPTPTSRDEFGTSVALDGNNVVIGAPRDDTNGTSIGQAHLFDASTGNLLQTFNDPTPTFADQFGYSVAVNGNNVLIGAFGDDTIGSGVGQAYLFDASTGNLLQTFNDPTPISINEFGGSVALDGKNALIGASRYDRNSGLMQAYLFEISVPEPGTSCLLLGMSLLASIGRTRI